MIAKWLGGQTAYLETSYCVSFDCREKHSKCTSTRKPRINPALVAAQAAGSSQKRPRSTSLKKKRRHPPRLSNVDRSSAQTREVTVSGVTVVITEYKPKKSVSSSSSDVESSNDTRT
ncbi:RING1 and YY1-binding protein A isoform X2 [Papilio machaon]|uniref:RING1 and YY1-binding protein A isoform X2 n=1 Tax=Papilio machaon TaxID=76193 RepID=UPI0006EAE77E|nr:RING1 and YY1-binding protein A isoform X2 [Papilio machaon]